MQKTKSSHSDPKKVELLLRKVYSIVMFLTLAALSIPFSALAEVGEACEDHLVQPTPNKTKLKLILEQLSDQFLSVRPNTPFPKKVSGYEPIKYLGGGAEGVVYLAKHLKTERLVTIKFFIWKESTGMSERLTSLAHLRENLQHLRKVSQEFRTPTVISTNHRKNYVIFEYVKGVPFHFAGRELSTLIVSDLSKEELFILKTHLDSLEEKLSQATTQRADILSSNSIISAESGEIVVVDPR